MLNKLRIGNLISKKPNSFDHNVLWFSENFCIYEIAFDVNFNVIFDDEI